MSEHHSDGRCMYCGGSVDAKGMSQGGVIEGDDFAEDGVNLDGDTSQMQMADAESDEARRDFIAAVRRKGGR